ncbi:LCP family protein [Proteiniclasticum sp. BAD-10]|uniref:LCP family protein n=1 Tax=Proteiniclasticum sediminis TaxID=2804028 RepID=A0A941CPV4_9CLOT|nr:LCP family protein [Proteiniclasticum sediminis]MBR0575603.1 LCP family protein [Proteiniclasticum sediminis]
MKRNVSQAEYNRKRRKRRNRIRTGLLVVMTLLMFSAGFGYAYIHNLLDSTNKDLISQKNDDLGIENPETPVETEGEPYEPEVDPKDKLPYYYHGVTGVTNIALFGVDAELGKAGRSDTIMIVTIDKNNNKIKLTSIMRDSYVDIEGKGMDKITHAYAYGKAQLAVKTLNTNFHLNIKDYATVNFTTLPKIIDILGGVTITVTKAEVPHIPGLTQAGTFNLKGDQALAYARIRKIDSDFARSERQRTVMKAIIDKMLKSPVTSYPGILSKILPLVTTNLSSSDILGMATSVVTNNIRTIEQNRYPEDAYAKGQIINGTWYYVFDRAKAVDAIGKYIYLDEKTEPVQTPN